MLFLCFDFEMKVRSFFGAHACQGVGPRKGKDHID